MSYTLVIISIIITFSTNVFAVEITGVDNKNILQHSKITTIVGKDFGIKNSVDLSGQRSVEPLNWDTFEDSTVGDYVDKKGYWTKRSRSGALINNTNNRNDKSQLNVKVEFNHEKSIYEWFYRNNVGFAKTGIAYVNMWLYCDFIEGDDSWQLKLWRINSDGNDHGSRPVVANTAWLGSVNPNVEFWNGFFINNADGSGQGTIYTKFKPTERYWYNVALLWRASSIGNNDGSVTVWTSKKFSENSPIDKISNDSINTRSIENDKNVDAIALGYLIESGGIQAVSYWDNIYLDNTAARVEIGDKSDYNECTYREIQIPKKWSRIGNPYQTIEIEVNQGSFPNGASAYVFVVDHNGVPSAGYPVTFQ